MSRVSPQVLHLLDSVRRRLLTRLGVEAGLRGLEGLVWLFLPALLLLTLGGAPWLVRGLFWLLAVGLATYLTKKYVIGPRRLYASPRSVAAYLEGRTPALRDRLVSATEFSLLPDTPLPYSRELAQAVVHEAGELTATLAPGDQVSYAGLRPLLWRLAAGLLLVVGLGLFFPAAFTRTGALLAGFSGDTQDDSLRTLAGDITLSYRYPAYTGLAPLTVPNSSGDIEAYPGTVVGISLRTQGSVPKAALQLGDGSLLPLNAEGVGRFSGELVTPLEKTHYSFVFGSRREGRKREISVIPDREPQVHVEYPPEELEVRETDRLEVDYRLEDDFGLTRLDLVVEFAVADGRETRRLPVATYESARKRDSGSWLWDLATMTLRPGDRVTYYLEALDNDGVQGPKAGRSPVHTLKVFSAYEHHQKLIQRQEEIWEAMIELLGKYLEQELNPTTLPRVEDVMATLANALTEIGEGIVLPLAALLDELKDDTLASEAMTQLLTTMHGDFSAHLGDYRAQLTQLQDFGPQRADPVWSVYQLIPLRNSSVVRLERYIIDLYELLKKEKFDALLAEGETLAALRDEIRRLLEEYKKTGDEAIKRRIAELLEEFRRRLTEMAARLADISKELPEEFVNRESMQTEAITKDLESLERLLEQDKLDEALAQLENMSLQLNEMLQGMKDGSERLGESLYSESMKQLMEMQKDLEQMIAKERDLHRQTGELAESYRKQAEELFRRNLKARMEEMMAKVRQAREHLEKVNEPDNAYLDRYMEGALSRLADLMRALEAQDVTAALEAARTAERGVDSILSIMQGHWTNTAAQQRTRNEQTSRAARGKIREVIEDLERLMPDPQRLMSEQDLQRMRQMAQQQQRLGQEAQRMSQQVRQMMDDMPFMPGEASQQMEQAGQGMEQARSELQQYQPGRAEGHQQQAIHSLQQLAEGLQQAMQQMQDGMQPGGMKPGMRESGPGRRMRQEKVGIPQAGDYQAPQELRQDILDAMKRKSPESYKPQTDQFYKELVK